MALTNWASIFMGICSAGSSSSESGSRAGRSSSGKSGLLSSNRGPGGLPLPPSKAAE